MINLQRKNLLRKIMLTAENQDHLKDLLQYK
jgi:hypothetical protein